MSDPATNMKIYQNTPQFDSRSNVGVVHIHSCTPPIECAKANGVKNVNKNTNKIILDILVVLSINCNSFLYTFVTTTANFFGFSIP